MERINEKQHQEIIDEIKLCEKVLTKKFNVYVSNTISRLVAARIRLTMSTYEPLENNPKEQVKQHE